MNTPFWKEIAPSEFAHEREAIDFLRTHLPAQAPFSGWSNFEFIDDQGRINECDALVLSSHTLYLIEIKSRPGTVHGDAGTWTWLDPRGRAFTDDNPYLLVNRKAKRLKSLLQRQEAFRRARLPFVEGVVFLSAPDLHCQLSPDGWVNVYQREKMAQLLAGDMGPLPVKGHQRIEANTQGWLDKALEQAGIRRSSSQRRVGDYTLERLLQESPAFQDWLGRHATLTKQQNRIRIYPLPPGQPASARAEVQRAAEREYLLTQRIHHPGIGRAVAFHDMERGPAVVFEYEPDALRLDHFLRERHDTLDFATRLRMLRQLAEALQHAHAQRVMHRALSPQAIHVGTGALAGGPQLRIFDWQLGQQEGASSSTLGGGMNPAVVGDFQALAYQAPEAVAGVGVDGIKADVFSLGVLAYHIVAGRPAATTYSELNAKIQATSGLLIAEALDGTPHALQHLIQAATRPIPVERLDDMTAFLRQLDAVEHERPAPAPETPSLHPADAQAGDTLPGGFVVQRRLGKGATSVAYEVEHHGKRWVLKVALDASQNERLRHEGQVLGTLRHAHIIALEAIVELPGAGGPYVALQLGAGGDGKTLAQRIREEGQLTLDLLERFGSELLDTVAWLEHNGVSHRDIKPDNITIGETRNGKRTLVLFDFSLSGAPLSDIRAGTPPYRDPFMARRRRWDLHAERFAAAVTLYEMATGLTPTWGDGATDPDLVGDALNLDVARFDPAVREGLEGFFRTALAAEAIHRFDNAEAMLRDWRRVFEALDRPATSHGETSDPGDFDLATLRHAATHGAAGASLASLGFSVRHINAAERLGANTLGEFLSLPRGRFYQAQGIGMRTLRELREIRETLAAASAPAPEEAPVLQAGLPPVRWSVDKLYKQATGLKLAPSELEALRALLGADARLLEPLPTLRDAAEAVGTSRQVLLSVLETAVSRWEKQPWMTALRDEVAGRVERLQGLATADELAQALLATRGSASAGDQRAREAWAVLAAALETEAEREAPRFQLYRGRRTVWVVASQGADERAAFGERLGDVADQLAAADPLVPPARAQELLRQVPPPPGEVAWPLERLLHVAVAAAKGAAVSSRLEIYPRPLPAERALRLAAGGLLGLHQLTPEQVQQRVRSRYPAAAPLPTGEALGALLAAAGLEYVWDAAGGVFRAPTVGPGSSTGSTTGTLPGLLVGGYDDESAVWQDFEQRLARVLAEGRFLLVNVEPRRLPQAEAALLERHGMGALSVEALLVQSLKAVAAEVEVAWQVVLDADGAPPGSEDQRNLAWLVEQAVARVRSTILAAPQPLVLKNLGLLARYQRLDLLESLRDACRNPHQPTPGLVCLLGADDPRALPSIDRKPVPVLEPVDWLSLPPGWPLRLAAPLLQEARS